MSVTGSLPREMARVGRPFARIHLVSLTLLHQICHVRTTRTCGETLIDEALINEVQDLSG